MDGACIQIVSHIRDLRDVYPIQDVRLGLEYLESEIKNILEEIRRSPEGIYLQPELSNHETYIGQQTQEDDTSELTLSLKQFTHHFDKDHQEGSISIEPSLPTAIGPGSRRTLTIPKPAYVSDKIEDDQDSVPAPSNAPKLVRQSTLRPRPAPGPRLPLIPASPQTAPAPPVPGPAEPASSILDSTIEQSRIFPAPPVPGLSTENVPDNTIKQSQHSSRATAEDAQYDLLIPMLTIPNDGVVIARDWKIS
ncbi:MAG: hypothetical protein Q9178_008073 [Gyalolechia marmorata]